jgi:hypothetical protein
MPALAATLISPLSFSLESAVAVGRAELVLDVVGAKTSSLVVVGVVVDVGASSRPVMLIVDVGGLRVGGSMTVEKSSACLRTASIAGELLDGGVAILFA